MKAKMKRIRPSRWLTRGEVKFLLTATDWLEDPELKGMTKAKILSRLGALGFGIRNSPLPKTEKEPLND